MPSEINVTSGDWVGPQKINNGDLGHIIRYTLAVIGLRRIPNTNNGSENFPEIIEPSPL